MRSNDPCQQIKERKKTRLKLHSNSDRYSYAYDRISDAQQKERNYL